RRGGDRDRPLPPPASAGGVDPGGAVASHDHQASCETLSVFFDPALVPSPDERARILPAAPLIKEMTLYAARWPILRSVSDPMADGFFETLAHLVLEWLDRETPLCLPTSREPVVAMAMEYT